MEKIELSLSEIQNGSFEVLKKIKEIFDKNGWKYYLAFGTLLGAIRHEGFIPWDDDIDVCVPREDYECFIKYCIDKKEELKPFELIHYSTNPKYIYPIARFSDSRYTLNYKDAKDYGLGLFVDVYPMDGIDFNDKKYIKKMRRRINDICLLGSTKFIKSKNIIKTIIKYPYYLFLKHKNINKFIEKTDKLAQKYSFNESEYFSVVCWGIKFDKKYKRKWLDGGEALECFKVFNDIKFRVPYEYDKYLEMAYGNYLQLPPEEERIAHHFYRAYKK